MDNSKVNLLEMTCLNDGHENSKLVAFCNDPTCTFQNKFVCVECIFQFHEQHKLVNLKVIQDKINTNLINDYSKDEQSLETKLKETEESILMEVEKIKTTILEIFNNKVNNFISEVTDRIMELQKTHKKSEQFDLHSLINSEIKNFPQEEIANLQNYIKFNLISNQTETNEQQDKIKKKSPFSELDKFNDNFKKYVGDVNKTLCDFLNSKFFVTPSIILFSENLYFEWSEKTYGNYGLFYNITNNKLTATKSQSDGTITILRSKEKLNINENYYIEFLVEWKTFGDCEVGFGRDNVGPNCWLRTPGAYGITNVGVYENGKITKKEIRLEDGDVIGMEIYLKSDKSNHRICKFFKNSKFVHECKIEIEELFIMIAIRKLGNSITVKDFKTLN
jgi:hypothetical protein